jgi:hypothetical protein
MAVKACKGQRDLIDFAEVQHQDVNAELRAALLDIVRAAEDSRQGYAEIPQCVLNVARELVGEQPAPVEWTLDEIMAREG